MARTNMLILRSGVLGRTSKLALVLGCLLASASACGGDDETRVAPDDPDAAGSPPAVVDAGSDADDDDISDEDNDVPCTADYPDYSDGLTAKAGTMTVRLLTISPTPPRQIVDNDWLVEIHNADQTVATGATITSADSYMPVHKHHGLTPPVVQPGDSPGQVKVKAINFRMRGPWQVSMNVALDGGTPVLATFPICVQ